MRLSCGTSSRPRITTCRNAVVEIFTYILTAILAVALSGAGIFLCCRQQPARTTTVTAVLSIAFLMLLLLHMSKFKHVKGFGFDAETWDETQVQAAKLVNQLSSASEALSEQVSLLASRLGLWDSGLTNPELAAILRQTTKQLTEANIAKEKQREILEPIRRRISLNYWRAAQHLVEAAYVQKYNALVEHGGDKEKAAALLNERNSLNALNDDNPQTLEELIDPIKASKVFVPPQKLMDDLSDLDEDLRFFHANDENKLRRDIDLEKVYPYPAPFLSP